MKGSKAAPIYLLELIKKNTQTITGKNNKLILNETGKLRIEDVSIDDLKENIKLKKMHEEDKWKVIAIRELTNVKQNKFQLCSENGNDFFSKKEMDFLISDLSRS